MKSCLSCTSFLFLLPHGAFEFILLKISLTKDNKWYIMPLVKKAKLIKHVKVKEDTGNIIEAKMWQVMLSTDKPHGYKYSLAYIVKGKRVIGYDNSEEKGDHRHYLKEVEPYKFKDLRTLSEDFYKDIERFKEGKL